MGGSVHRFEILLIGMMLLIAGSVVAIQMVIRPPAQPAYTMATSVPVVLPTEPAVIIAPTQVPASSSPRTVTESLDGSSSPQLALSPHVIGMLLRIWPFLLLAVGGIGLLLAGRRIRRQRPMAYTGQNMGMLLAAADATTRASTLRVLRELKNQGQLPEELAAAAGLTRPKRWSVPVIRLPRLTLPRLSLPTLSRPVLLHAAVWQRLYSIFRQKLTQLTSRMRQTRSSNNGVAEQSGMYSEATPALSLETEARVVEHAEDNTGALEALVIDEQASVSGLLTQEPRLLAESVQLIQELNISETSNTAEWTAEDRVLTVAHVLAELWQAEQLSSPILAIDTTANPGSAQVIVSIDAVPGDDQRLAYIPERLLTLYPGWCAQWKVTRQRTALVIDIDTTGASPVSGGPLIGPVLQHGRGTPLSRYYPLTTWRHLGLYGADAPGALHALLTGLLYMQPPSDLALSILDQGQLSPLYKGIPHLIQASGDLYGTLDQLLRGLHRGSALLPDNRQLLLVIVEPDAEALTQLAGLLKVLRQQPDVPLHLLLVQERLLAAGSDVYATLPALMTPGGQGNVSWLPGQPAEWPKRGTARLAGRGMRIDGRPITLTEAATAELLAPLRRPGESVSPVLWELDSVRTLVSDIPLSEAPVGEQAPSRPADSPPVLLVDEFEVSTEAALPVVEVEVPISTTDETIAAVGTPVQQACVTEAEVIPELLTQSEEPESQSGPERGGDLPGMATVSNLETAMLEAVLSRIDLALSLPLSPVVPQNALEQSIAPVRIIEEPENGWPSGPTPLGRVGLATLMEALISDPEIMHAKQADQVGVTKKRLQALGLKLNIFPEAQARALAETLIVWFDQASVLVMPLKVKEHPLNQPRAIERTDLEWICERLTATPIPTSETVRSAWLPTLGGTSQP